MTRTRRLAATWVACLAGLTAVAAAQQGPPPQVRATLQAVERMLGSADDASIRALVDERFTPAYRAAEPDASRLTRLRAMRAALGGPIDGVSVMRDDRGLLMEVMGPKTLRLRLVLDDTGLVERLGVEPAPGRADAPDAAGARAGGVWAGVTWDTLDATVHRAADAGFSGVVLARRDGKVVTRQAAGLADRDARRATALDTVYCIGSTPIDFTVTAVMLLGQRGALTLDAPLTTYLPDAPADKRGITLRHLLTGASGLPDFFHLPSDWDADLAYIDRDTAVRRILAQPLLFAPGGGSAHSHGAFVLAAAIVEIVSGTPYRDVIRREILTPLGMTRTGFYGETLGLGLDQFATGYGVSRVGLPNIPPNWGPTSWLVMGSGGMVSTLDDLDRYYTAIDEGRLLTGPWAQWQQGRRASAGGSERGYFILRVSGGRGTNVLYLTNGGGRSPVNVEMSAAIEALVLRR